MTTTASLTESGPVRAAREAIVATIVDYYVGWYDGDADRMARALHPGLTKRGWLRDEAGGHELTTSTFESMVGATREGRGRRADPAERRYEIRAVEIFDDVASACVYAVPYLDYLHLVRTEDGWRILNALWRKP